MGTAFALNRLGSLASALGEHELGREWLEEGLALRRELGDRRGVGMTLSNLGVLAARAGDLERGRSLIGDASSVSSNSANASPIKDRPRSRSGGHAAQSRQHRR